MGLTPPSSHGSSAVPTPREEWSGNGVAISDGDGAWLTWNSSAGPDAVLDNAVPAHPTVATAGVYFVSVVVNVGTLSANGYYDAGLHLDRTGFNASEYAFSSQAGPAPQDRVAGVTLGFAWYLPAGAEVGVFVDNFDGAQAHNFAIAYAHVQRVA